jgi:hypothetical protein
MDGRVLEQLETSIAVFYFWHIETAFGVVCFVALIYDLMNNFRT